ncbi:hypothetical protein Patl1_12267 [Pistacia atlantica]|uniref:Uncharacterized protein n=1 Tax=Pistacia atlantica TaxID=434234 RepID=A0ACC1A560_9ROSI|nr:hypothetical protein Patl1_12267 [Pistacia atlantica]
MHNIEKKIEKRKLDHTTNKRPSKRADHTTNQKCKLFPSQKHSKQNTSICQSHKPIPPN